MVRIALNSRIVIHWLVSWLTETSVCLQNKKIKEKLKAPPKNSEKKRNEINTQSQDKSDCWNNVVKRENSNLISNNK